jgi:phosphoglycerate dehydrogenase-like enzyme
MRVLYCGSGWNDVVPLVRDAIARAGVVAEFSTRDHARPLADQLREVEVVLPSNSPLDATAIAAAPRLRLIQQPAVGYEWIDLEAARARSIPVCNTPGSNADSVAQATLLLVLALARRWDRAQRMFREARIGSPAGLELTGRAIAIVGMGRAGSRLRSAVEALGMRVIAVTREGGRRALLDALSAADFVTLHTPVTPETRGFFDDEAFAAMRPGAFLVNVARGALVDRGALERALDRLGGVGLDVFWEEPWDPRDPLYARENVLVLPHVAGSTLEAFGRVAEIVAHNVAAIVRGEPLVHRIA